MRVVADYKTQMCDTFSIEVFPTVLFLEKGEVTKRLDGEAGQGLNQKQLEAFAKKC